MRRRDFIKAAAAATGGLLSNSSPSGVNAQGFPTASQAHRVAEEIPDLDELSGDWMAADLIEQTPALANFHGSLEASRNVLGVENFTVPPFAQGGELADLLLNGTYIPAEEFRWHPYQIQRRASLEGVDILTTVRMPFEQCGILFAIEITNKGAAPFIATLAITANAAIRQYGGKWTWETSRPGQEAEGDFKSEAMHLGDDNVLYTRDTRSQSGAGFIFFPNPDQTSPDSSIATWPLALAPGETLTLRGVISAGSESDAVARQAGRWKAKFSALWEEARTRWQERYLAAFDRNNRHFSGNLPTLVTPDASIRKLYYSSIVSLLCLERTNLDSRYPRVFVSASPRWATTLVYFWDTGLFPTVWALLDPAAMKQQIRLFLGSNIHSCYAMDFYSMETVGPWYSANDYSVFQLVTTYVNVTGDRHFFEETVEGNKRVIDYLEEISLHWRTLTMTSSLLANYGDASNLLETVPTYIHGVPSLNAANVWMLRSMAKIRSARGETARAKELEQHADGLAAEVLGLYVDGQGVWACLLTVGSKIEVRHCIDFFTAIAAMQDDLGPRRIEEMIGFVNRELWTPHWLRALSLRDGAAGVSTRPDHGSTGAYDAWPALTAEAIFRAGRKAEALERLRSVEPATREGPLGQAHYVATQAYPVRKAIRENDYFESASGSFAEVILRTVFGFAPTAGEEWSPTPAMVPGFEGSLRNLRYRDKFLTIAIQPSPHST